MSLLDELMREKGIIDGALTHIPAGSVGATELDDETITVSDIADNAVTAAKIAAAVAGDGIAGGAGTALSVDVDDSTVAIVTNKVAVKDAGVTAAKLAAAAKKKEVSVPLGTFTANTTVYVPVLSVPAGKQYTITKVEIAAETVPIDADGTCLLSLVNSDVSAGPADVDVVAPWDTEGIAAAKTGEALTVITAASANVLDPTDYLFVKLVNNSAAIDQNIVGGILTIEYNE